MTEVTFMKKLIYLLLLCWISNDLLAQQSFPVNGVHDERESSYAFTNATIFTQYNKKIENATLLIREGRVEAVGAGVTIPKEAITIDLKGKYIYPSFIDIYSNYGLPEPKKSERKWSDPPQFISKKKGAYNWNEAIHPEYNAFENFSANEEKAKVYREIGFGTVLSHQKDGIARGSGVLALVGGGKDHEIILKDKASAHYSFRKGNSGQNYPSSLMGSIALLKQTFYDADWYKAAKYTEEYNISLDSWNQLEELPQIMEVRDLLTILRADKLGDEFNVQYTIKANGHEYKRLEAIKATNATLIVPLKYPKAYDVEDPLNALNVSLADMKHWELAPSNAAKLAEAGVKFALTPADLKDMKDFNGNLQKAIKKGLSHEDALKALTQTPAQIVNSYDQVGSLEKGKVANFLITSDSLFTKDCKVYQNWIRGKKYELKKMETTDLAGAYQLKIGKYTNDLEIEGKPDKQKAAIRINDSTKVSVHHHVDEKAISLHFNTAKDSLLKTKLSDGFVRLSGWMDDDNKNWQGRGQLANGEWVEWTAKYKGEVKKDEKKEDKAKDEKKGKDKEKDSDKAKKDEKPGDITYPFIAYGWTEKPTAEAVLFQNATVWTNEEDGILTETDVLIENGKVKAIGEDLEVGAGTKKVDARGKHLTSGIIDEHSHIAISRGVNEGSQASSAEVSIADVVNSEDINIYRQLAGGVTSAQLLHGSANPIGGQSAIIKFRWGLTPEEMKFENADPFIKFALGENVKQSNWGDNNTVRFPQTRMGVEQVYIDHFTRALEYEKAKNNNKNGKPFRRDLELETLLQIINKERFITCHSYVQSEITMLMRVAEQFGFNINTFTHILEGYKIADKMQKHGVAGSTFSDWWAYKYEVIDAIPHNGTIMHEMGVVTSFNSDDAEMGRRLNQEAAKAVKYGGLSEEEAWKFVTLNPAKMLHLDDRVGSIKVGKDADMVLWSDNPLSIYAKAEQTYVDGICYFDLEQDAILRKQINEERNRLVQKMLKIKKGGGETQKPMPKRAKHYHCDTMGE